jgi:hypothetical protein
MPSLIYFLLGKNPSMSESTLPNTIELPRIQTLDMQNMRLTGTIPSAFYSMTKLQDLSMCCNTVSGTLSEKVSVNEDHDSGMLCCYIYTNVANCASHSAARRAEGFGQLVHRPQYSDRHPALVALVNA